jgi:hypothetical protein
MIRVFHPGSGSPYLDPDFLPIPDPDPVSQIPNPGVKKAPEPWSRIRIRNTGDFGFAQAVGGTVGYWPSTGAAVLTTHLMDQLSEAFMCKKEFSVYFILPLSLIFTVFKLWCPAHLFPNTPRNWRIFSSYPLWRIFTSNPSQIKHDNITGIIYYYELL